MKGLTTLKEIERAMRALWREDPEYARTLLGPRTRGSTTERALFELGAHGAPTLQVRDRPIAYVGVGRGDASIYTAEIPELGGSLGARAIEDLTDAELAQVRVRRGAHGLELVLPSDAERKRVDVVTFVVATDGALLTWHPGLPLDPLGGATAVKLV